MIRFLVFDVMRPRLMLIVKSIVPAFLPALAVAVKNLFKPSRVGFAATGLSALIAASSHFVIWPAKIFAIVVDDSCRIVPAGLTLSSRYATPIAPEIIGTKTKDAR